jgi:hypothetical protein
MPQPSLDEGWLHDTSGQVWIIIAGFVLVGMAGGRHADDERPIHA